MKYISKSVLTALFVMLAIVPQGVQAAVTSLGLDDFGLPAQALDRPLASGAARNYEPNGAQSAVAPSRVVPLLAPAKGPARPENLGVFSSVAISAARLPATANWNAVSARSYAELFTNQCAGAGLAGCDTVFATKLRAVSARVQNMSAAQTLGVVNRSVNGAMRYRSDARNWGQGDYWADPSEVAQKGAGDCEDFAIAKYWLLRSLGFSADKLQVVVLSDTRRQLYHAVLVAHVDGVAYVLDNLSNAVSTDQRYTNYMPIMSFVAGKSYIHGFSGRSSATAALPADMRLVSPGEGL